MVVLSFGYNYGCIIIRTLSYFNLENNSETYKCSPHNSIIFANKVLLRKVITKVIIVIITLVITTAVIPFRLIFSQYQGNFTFL